MIIDSITTFNTNISIDFLHILSSLFEKEDPSTLIKSISFTNVINIESDI